jgi:hypothetical protein
VLLDAKHNMFYSLNESAGVVWRLLLDTQSIGDLVVALQGQYDIDSQRLQEDMQTLIAALSQRHLIACVA